MTNETTPSRPSETCTPSVSGKRSKSDVEADDATVAWLDDFTKRMAHPDPAEEEFFAQRRQLSLGAGIGENGKPA